MKAGVNIYSFRKYLAEDVEDTFLKIAELGIETVEPWINIGQEYDNPRHGKNQSWKARHMEKEMTILDRCGLKVPSAFVFAKEFDDPKMAEDINMLHGKYGINAFIFWNTHLETKKQADKMCEGFNRLLNEVDEGISILYHNHNNEYEYETDGQPLMEYILEKCPKMGLEADFGWFQYVGLNPNTYLKKYRERVKILHFKDLSEGYGPTTINSMCCPIGDGVVDFKTALLHLNEYPNLMEPKIIIDQDDANTDMYQEVKKGMNYINKILNL